MDGLNKFTSLRHFEEEKGSIRIKYFEIASRRSLQGGITTFPFFIYRLLINSAKQRKIRFDTSQRMVFTVTYALDLTLQIKTLFSGP